MIRPTTVLCASLQLANPCTYCTIQRGVGLPGSPVVIELTWGINNAQYCVGTDVLDPSREADFWGTHKRVISYLFHDCPNIVGRAFGPPAAADLPYAISSGQVTSTNRSNCALSNSHLTSYAPIRYSHRCSGEDRSYFGQAGQFTLFSLRLQLNFLLRLVLSDFILRIWLRIIKLHLQYGLISRHVGATTFEQCVRSNLRFANWCLKSQVCDSDNTAICRWHRQN